MGEPPMLQMSRRTGRMRGTGRAELVGLALVLIAGVATAWWAGGRITSHLDISGLTGFARVLGIFDVSQPLRREEGTPIQQQQPAVTATAAYCQPGQQPAFAMGAADLKQQLGDTVGAPLECEHPVSGTGDTIQQTTTGLVMYRAATNTVMFTDGWRHWALTPRGMVRWEGTASDPPTG
jgi:hypothetical protein